MLLLPVAIIGLYLAIDQQAIDYAAYFAVLAFVVLLGAWDALNDW
jgi:hypothetical protein